MDPMPPIFVGIQVNCRNCAGSGLASEFRPGPGQTGPVLVPVVCGGCDGNGKQTVRERERLAPEPAKESVITACMSKDSAAR